MQVNVRGETAGEVQVEKTWRRVVESEDGT